MKNNTGNISISNNRVKEFEALVAGVAKLSEHFVSAFNIMFGIKTKNTRYCFIIFIKFFLNYTINFYFFVYIAFNKTTES